MTATTRARLMNVSLFFCSCLAGLAVAEGMVRKWAPRETSVPWQDELDGVSCPRPNVKGRCAIPDTFDIRLTINSQRFRAPEDFTQKPAPGVLRIAALGDSFTHGVGADDEATYPAQLERLIEQRRRDDAPGGTVEILNSGTNGTGTSDQALFFHLWVARFKPHLVLLNVWMNDVEEDLSRRLFTLASDGTAVPNDLQSLRAADNRIRLYRKLANSVPGYSFLAQHFQLVGFLRTTATAAVGRQRAAIFASDHAKTGSGEERFVREGLPLMAGEIRWLRDRVEAEGAKLVIVHVPPRESIYPAQYPHGDGLRWRSQQIGLTLEEVSRTSGIPLIDLTAPVQQRAAATIAPLYYSSGDFHATPAGYRAFAEIVHHFLQQRQLL